MAKVLNLSSGGRGIHSLPKKDKDGKPDLTTVRYFFLPPASQKDKDGNTVPGGCEIPDDLLAELRANDPFVQGLFASRQVVIDDSNTPSLVASSELTAARDGGKVDGGAPAGGEGGPDGKPDGQQQPDPTATGTPAPEGKKKK